jgi:uncharacterized 2Fe-2S/4Fe-4S cluster protein (DUF4445 family)
MAAKTHRVLFEPDGRTVSVPDGRTIFEAAREAGVPLGGPCGGHGTCGGCRVVIPENAPLPTDACRRELPAEDIARHVRLACQVRVRGDLRVIIPPETRPPDQKVLVDGVERPVPLEPNVRKVEVHLPMPSIDDPRADTERLLDGLSEKGLAGLEVDMRTARDLPERLRALDFHPAAVVIGRQVIHVDRPTTHEACYGIAYDIGTTTLVGYLVDLVTGRTAAAAGRTNPQADFGDDVIARLEFCLRRKDGADVLNGQVVAALNEILREVCRKADIRTTAVYEAVIVGNTTMNHLALRLPVESIARAPFVPASGASHTLSARDMGLRLHPRGQVYAAPLVAGFVGADTVAVILATGMNEGRRLRLAIDIGTNGEVVLGTRDRLLVCSTAAGPAFEGARIRCGMRAAAGAIDRVDLVGGDLALHTLDDAPPLGLCGTGLLDAVATLVEAGVIDSSGLIRPAREVAASRPALARRITGADGETAVVLVAKGQAPEGRPILLTQKDIREVQLAKGAIAAGVETLLEEYGARPQDIDEVFLAGAFGSLLRPDRALAVGLLPPVPPERIRFVGNAAGTGARMLLLNRDLRRAADDLARGIEHVELSCRPDFAARFAEAMAFPAPVK